MNAEKFAEEAHFGQRRKYSGEPYFNHCKRVAAIIRNYFPKEAAVINASYLHDTLENTKVTDDELYNEFGIEVASIVQRLTMPENLNREQKLNWAILNFKKAPIEVKAIKLADIIDNCSDLHIYDREFARIYYREKRILIAEALFNGPKELVNSAFEKCCYA